MGFKQFFPSWDNHRKGLCLAQQPLSWKKWALLIRNMNPVGAVFPTETLRECEHACLQIISVSSNAKKCTFVGAGFAKVLGTVDLINPQTVRAGLADPSVSSHEFDHKTRPEEISNLFNSHSLALVQSFWG